MTATPYWNRREAGEHLGNRLAGTPGELIVIALPRGGVPVGAEVARALSCPFDVLVVRKLGVPSHPELGFGALAEHGIRVLNEPLVHGMGITERAIDDAAAVERLELERRVEAYRRGRPMLPVGGKVVIVVDDGMATGFTAMAAVEALRLLGPEQVILAVPVAPTDAVEDLGAVADEVIVLQTPAYFGSVGEWYDDFEQVSDNEVADIVAELAGEAAAPADDAGQRRG
ncbi:MAG: phosphoribosyltransferase [Acidimicrobiia bacterium]|nr:phosphoribosyltransferase [Acidimicrobiia bacterium]